MNSGTTTLAHVTVTNNDMGTYASQLGAIRVSSTANVSLSRSIVTSNFGSGPQCLGPIVSGDYNVVQSAASCPMSGQVTHNLNATGFNVLALNGGISRDVYSGFSLAAGAVPAAACLDDLGAPLTTDFRGFRRPSSACDIGAHDSGAFYKPSQLIDVNLLRNGGKTGEELGLADQTLAEDMQAPYWAQSGFVLQRLYGPSNFLTLSNAPPGGGHKFLSGWLENATATQLIDVSALAASIDAGSVAYQIGGSFGGKTTENDRATLDVYFYNAGFGLLRTETLGGFTAANRGNQTKLIRALRTATVPVGTRMIDAQVRFERIDGFTNEAYADGLSVTLPEPDVAASLGAALIVLAGLARGRRSPES